MAKWMRKKESWPRFVSKAALVLGLMVGAGVAFASRYSIAIDPQEISCIPEYRVYLLDHKGGDELKRGALYAFNSKPLLPFYPEGERLLKYMQGMPGDQVEVNPDFQVKVNNQHIAYGLDLSEKMNVEPQRFVGKGTLGANQYWMLGTGQQSFDSRYWGSINSEQIYARAYPLF